MLTSSASAMVAAVPPSSDNSDSSAVYLASNSISFDWWVWYLHNEDRSMGKNANEIITCMKATTNTSYYHHGAAEGVWEALVAAVLQIPVFYLPFFIVI